MISVRLIGCYEYRPHFLPRIAFTEPGGFHHGVVRYLAAAVFLKVRCVAILLSLDQPNQVIPEYIAHFLGSTISMTTPISSKQFIQFSAVTFLGLGISRTTFPKHCRGCQCEKLNGSEDPGTDPRGLSDRSAQHRLQPDALRA
jgi:hypothetical protein